MSTNPFRREQSGPLKGAGTSTPRASSTADLRGSSPVPLTVDTTVTRVSQKHVNFASPPDIISPASYPPSPESTRQEFLPPFDSPGAPAPLAPNYGQVIASDPFAEGSDGEEDSAIGEALENARANSSIATEDADWQRASKADAVRDTLSRFAGAPRKPVDNGASAGTKDLAGSAARATMDVDAFKRMLLTGERGPAPPTPTAAVAGHFPPVSDGSSIADTASISQQSLFEPGHAARDESPRTSDELDAAQADDLRKAADLAAEGRKKPPPPKSRRGKPAKEVDFSESGPPPSFDNFINSLSAPGSRTVSSEPSVAKVLPTERRASVDAAAPSGVLESQRRTPPAPPAARRKTQPPSDRPTLARSLSARQSAISDYDVPLSPVSATPASKPPPPPPSRRTTSTGEVKPSVGVTDPVRSADTPLPPPAPPIPAARSDQLSHTPSAAKRMSQPPPPPPPPPPVPPPRRARGSSRSSMERSGATMLSRRESGDDALAKTESIDARDILADLAALQREVDAARASAENG